MITFLFLFWYNSMDAKIISNEFEHAADLIVQELRNHMILSTEMETRGEPFHKRNDRFKKRDSIDKKDKSLNSKDLWLSLGYGLVSMYHRNNYPYPYSYGMYNGGNQESPYQSPYYQQQSPYYQQQPPFNQQQFGNPYQSPNPYNPYNQNQGYNPGGNPYEFNNGYNQYPNQYYGNNNPYGRVGGNDFFSRGTGKSKEKRSLVDLWGLKVLETLLLFRGAVVDVLDREFYRSPNVILFISNVKSSLTKAWKPFALHLESFKTKKSLIKRDENKRDLSNPKNRGFMRSKDYENQGVAMSTKIKKSVSFPRLISLLFLIPIVIYTLDQLFYNHQKNE